jgi:hypothetical protein
MNEPLLRTLTILVLLAACSGACGHAARVITPLQMERAVDPSGPYVQVSDSLLMVMRSSRGARLIDITFGRVELDAGTWRIAGCVGQGLRCLPVPGVRVMIGQMPWCCPEMLLSGEMPAVRVIGTTVRCTTGADGTFEILAPADSASCLVIGNSGDLMEMYELWRLGR